MILKSLLYFLFFVRSLDNQACIDDILADLGKMYVADERLRRISTSMEKGLLSLPRKQS